MKTSRQQPPARHPAPVRPPRRRPILSISVAILLCATAGTLLPRPERLAPGAVHASAVPTGYLHTDGARIVDSAGRAMRMVGINWFGLETCAFAPHGLWTRNWR
ncbi:MAG TPA: hypothetical protein VHB98_16390, partial [Chloroflexota bacterium]|nr:hypothetical protein [Chloroflexota bacterium]